jgi:hypothetical protein
MPRLVMAVNRHSVTARAGRPCREPQENRGLNRAMVSEPGVAHAVIAAHRQNDRPRVP